MRQVKSGATPQLTSKTVKESRVCTESKKTITKKGYGSYLTMHWFCLSTLLSLSTSTLPQRSLLTTRSRRIKTCSTRSVTNFFKQSRQHPRFLRILTSRRQQETKCSSWTCIWLLLILIGPIWGRTRRRLWTSWNSVTSKNCIRTRTSL